jgi:flagellar motor protein MotB
MSKPEQTNSSIPNEFRCAISHELMKNPVILVGDKQTYEKHNIEKWLKVQKESPLTRKKLEGNDLLLVSNKSLKMAIENWKKGYKNVSDGMSPQTHVMLGMMDRLIETNAQMQKEIAKLQEENKKLQELKYQNNEIIDKLKLLIKQYEKSESIDEKTIQLTVDTVQEPQNEEADDGIYSTDLDLLIESLEDDDESLTSLDFHQVKEPFDTLGEEQIHDLSQVLASSERVTKVSFNGKSVNDTCVKYLSTYLRPNQALKELSFANNPGITDKGAELIAKLIRVNKGLTRFVIIFVLTVVSDCRSDETKHNN